MIQQDMLDDVRKNSQRRKTLGKVCLVVFIVLIFSLVGAAFRGASDQNVRAEVHKHDIAIALQKQSAANKKFAANRDFFDSFVFMSPEWKAFENTSADAYYAKLTHDTAMIAAKYETYQNGLHWTKDNRELMAQEMSVVNNSSVDPRASRMQAIRLMALDGAETACKDAKAAKMTLPDFIAKNLEENHNVTPNQMLIGASEDEMKIQENAFIKVQAAYVLTCMEQE